MYEGLEDLNRALYRAEEAMYHHPENKRHKRWYKRLEAKMEKHGIVPATYAFGKGTDWWVG